MRVPDFKISPGKEISDLFIQKGITDFSSACRYIKHLPYRRTSSKMDLPLVLTEERGTCSTKHAVLTILAEENGFHDIKLMMGIFKMCGDTVKGISSILEKYGLCYIPEAHNYIMYNGRRYDFTFTGLNEDLIFEGVMNEIEINASQIGQYKIDYHKNFLDKWFAENYKESNLTLEDIWNIREECIKRLSR